MCIVTSTAKKGSFFCIVSSLGRKYGYITVISSAENYSAILANHPHQLQIRISIIRKWCSVFGIRRGSSIQRDSNLVKPLPGIVTDNNSCIWNANWKQNDRNTPESRTRGFSSMTSIDHDNWHDISRTVKETHEMFGWDVLTIRFIPQTLLLRIITCCDKCRIIFPNSTPLPLKVSKNGSIYG